MAEFFERLPPANVVGTLTVVVHKAADLRSVQALGTQDPYVTVMIAGKQLQTKYHDDGGKNPVWEQKLGPWKLEGKESFARLQVHNKNNIGDDHIATLYLKLDQLLSANQPVWFTVFKSDNMKQSETCGKLLISTQLVGAAAQAPPAQPQPPAQPCPVPQPQPQPVRAPVQPQAPPNQFYGQGPPVQQQQPPANQFYGQGPPVQQQPMPQPVPVPVPVVQQPIQQQPIHQQPIPNQFYAQQPVKQPIQPIMAQQPVMVAPQPVPVQQPRVEVKAGLQWKPLPGAGINISTGSVQHSVACGNDSRIYRLVNGAWQQLPGQARDVSIGADGELWACNAAGGVYRWTGQAWQQMPGDNVMWVSVANAQNVVAVQNDQDIFKWNAGMNSWTQLPGKATKVSVGADGELWAVTAKQEIYRWVNSSWTKMPGAAIHITVGSAQHVYAVNGQGQIYHWANSWQLQSGKCRSLEAASDGHLVANTTDNKFYEHKPAMGMGGGMGQQQMGGGSSMGGGMMGGGMGM